MFKIDRVADVTFEFVKTTVEPRSKFEITFNFLFVHKVPFYLNIMLTLYKLQHYDQIALCHLIIASLESSSMITLVKLKFYI